MSDINIKIQLQTKELNSAVKAAKKSLEGLEVSGKDAGKGLAKGAKTAGDAWASFKGNLGAAAVVSAFKSVVTAVGGIGKGVVDAASSIEDLTAEFTSLTGSAENASKLLEDLATFSSKTPFQIEGLASASKTLLAFGFEQEKIIENLQVLGDVSAVTGRNVKDISLIFGQVAAAGKLTGERLNQLQESGIPVLKVLGEQLGETQGSVRELVSKGKIDFKTFEKAFKSLNKEGGIAFEGMQNKSETLSGVISTLQDNFFLLSADIGDELLPILKDAATSITEFIKANKDVIAGTIRSGFQSIITVVKTLAETASTLSDIWDFIQSGFSSLVSSMLTGFKSILEVVAVIEMGVTSGFKSILDIIGGFASSVIQTSLDLQNSIAGVFGIDFEPPAAIKQLQSNLDSLGDSLDTTSSSVDGAVESLNTYISAADKSADNAILAAVDKQAVSYAEVSTNAKEAAASVNDLAKASTDIKPLQASGKKAGEEFVEQVSRDLPSVLRASAKDAGFLKETFRAATPGPVPGGESGALDFSKFTFGAPIVVPEASAEQKSREEFSKSVKEFTKGAVSFASSASTGFLEGALAGVASGDGEKSAREATVKGLTAGIDAALPGVGKIAGPFLDLFSQGPEATKSFVEDFAQALPLIITAIAESAPVFVEAIIDALPEIIVALVKASPKIIKALTVGLASALFEGVREFFQGEFVDGISKAASDTTEAANTFNQQISEAGNNIVNGFNGLLDNIANISQAINDSGLALKSGAESARNSIITGAQESVVVLKDGILAAITSIGPGLKLIIETLGAGVGTIVSKIGEGLALALQGFVTQLLPAVSDIIQTGISGFVNGVTEGVTSGFVQIGEEIGNLLSSVLTPIIESLSNFNLAEGLDEFTTTLKDAGDEFLFTILDAGDALIGSVIGAGKRFVDGITGLFSDLELPSVGGSGSGGVVGSVRGALGLATGGIVTGSGVRDTVPAVLTPGELVVDRSTGPKLMEFINNSQSGAGNAETNALLLQILSSLSQPMNVTTTAEIDGNNLADIVLELSRNNNRLG